MEPAGFWDWGDVLADSWRRSSVGRNSMALSGNRDRGLRAGGAGRLEFFEGRPEGAADHLRQSGCGPQGTRLPGDPVEDRGGTRWDVGQGRDSGNPDATAISAGAAHGFYFLGVRRGTWIRGCGGGAGFVFSAADASSSERANGAGSRRDVYLHGGGNSVVVPPVGERGHGGRVHARDRNSAAADELRRVEHVFDFYDAGAGEQ